MRPIAPISRKKNVETVDADKDRESLWHLVLPFNVFSQSLRLDVILTNQIQENEFSSGRRSKMAVALLQTILFVMLMLMMAGMFFCLYLVKKSLGIDFFPTSHLL